MFATQFSGKRCPMQVKTDERCQNMILFAIIFENWGMWRKIILNCRKGKPNQGNDRWFRTCK
jgi:hypothetical protein